MNEKSFLSDLNSLSFIDWQVVYIVDELDNEKTEFFVEFRDVFVKIEGSDCVDIQGLESF